MIKKCCFLQAPRYFLVSTLPLCLHIFVCTLICNNPHHCARFKILKTSVFSSALEHPSVSSIKTQKTQWNRTFHCLLRNTKETSKTDHVKMLPCRTIAWNYRKNTLYHIWWQEWMILEKPWIPGRKINFRILSTMQRTGCLP